MTTEPAPGQPRISERRAFVIVAIAVLVVLWLARGVIGPFVVAGFLAYAFSPLVFRAQERTHWPRPAIVGIGYVIAIAVIGLLAYFLAGRVAGELQQLSAAGPDLAATALRQLIGADSFSVGNQTLAVSDIASSIQASLANLTSSPGEAIHLATVVAETGLQAILVLIVTFYFLVDGRRFRDWTIELLPSIHRARTVEVLDHIHDVLGKWLRGQLLLIVLVAAVVYVFLGPILHLPYALAIGVLTGVLEIIPLVGPVIAAVIAATAALVSGGAPLALVVIVAFFILRQVEDQVVMPIVIGRAVHLHPVATIFAVLVGLSSFGILGGLLGVPIAAALNVVFRDLYALRAEPRPATPVRTRAAARGAPRA
jgi:predicted PurR-regulated permease PerM